MSFTSFTRASLLTALFGAVAAAPASAQFYDPCNVCQPIQPVAQTCYQTVPVTEYRQEQRTVLKPITEMKTVEQKFTEYVPVTEQRTAEVPYVTYQNVTECQTVTRDLGGWQTAYQPIAKMAPCQYDPNPTFGGWLNRTAYSIRSSFTPNYRTVRSYQPNVVAQTVPVTRQVAVRNTRQVTYNVTRYETRESSRMVQVPTTRYEKVVENVNVPVTVYRTVPTGTAITYGVSPYGYTTSRTVLGPSPDPISNVRSADSSADSYKRSDGSREAGNSDKTDANPLKKISNEETKGFDPFPSDTRVDQPNDTQVTAVSRKVPSVVRASGWRPTGSVAMAKAKTGPKLLAPSVAASQ